MRSTMVALLLIAVAVSGCSKSTARPQWDKITELQKENFQLTRQINTIAAENKELKKLNLNLAGFDAESRSQSLNRIDRLEIQDRTSLFDKDNDGIKETLIVYIKPYDDVGDPFKAAGSAEVELWDLSAQPQQARIAKWTVPPAELKKLWASTFMTSYFRLTFRLENKIPESTENLTIKLKFTDYITGKEFKIQKAFSIIK